VKQFIELLRPINSLMAATAVFIGGLVVGGEFVVHMTELHLAIIVTFIITGAGMAINDYFDREIDFLNKRHRPIPSGRVTPKGAFVFSLTLFAIGVYISFFINIPCFIIALVNSVLLFLYSFRFKKVFMLGHIFVSYLVASSFVFGGFAVNLDNMFPVTILAVLAFLSNVSREIVKSIEDMKGDRFGKVKSFPIIFGEKAARKVSSLLMAISIILAPLPYLLGYMNQNYMYVVSLGLVLFIFSIIWNLRDTPAGRVHKLMKVAMFVSLLAFLVGAL